MKKIWIASLAAAAGAWMAGCDWTGVGEDETLSDRFNWVSFSGVYRSATGSILITDYTITAAAESGSTNRVDNEHVASANGTDTQFSGTLDYSNLLPGSASFQLSGAGISFSDNGTGGLVGTGGRTGTINYSTGAWFLDFGGSPAPGLKIYASYSRILTPSPGSGGPNPGSTGKPIFSLNVAQSGNKLTITDNNGATYSGKISSIRSTGGQSQDLPGGTALPADGETVSASFEASGRSAAGISTKIVGTLSGVATVTAATTTAPAQVQINNRRMNGTWIEPSKTGDINAVANSGTLTTVP